jgi:tripartite-type tricarboxylate transporter receptor subunit TctC
MELFGTMAGIRMNAIAYKGDAPALTDAAAGQVMLALPTVIAAQPFLSSGKLKPIAVTRRNACPRCLGADGCGIGPG